MKNVTRKISGGSFPPSHNNTLTTLASMFRQVVSFLDHSFTQIPHKALDFQRELEFLNVLPMKHVPLVDHVCIHRSHREDTQLVQISVEGIEFL